MDGGALGACFAEAIGVRLNLPSEGARTKSIPGALVFLAPEECNDPPSHHLRANRNSMR
jgi:hypothetical protein